MNAGFCKLVTDPDHFGKLTRNGEYYSNRAYMAPEYLLGSKASPESEVFSLGCVMYECITGNKPFEAGPPGSLSRQQIVGRPKPFNLAKAGIPVRLESIVLRALEKLPQRRYGSILQLQWALWLLQLSTNQKSGRRLTESSLRHILVTAVVCCAIALIAILFVK
jgi:serine/threonine protein kinase